MSRQLHFLRERTRSSWGWQEGWWLLSGEIFCQRLYLETTIITLLYIFQVHWTLPPPTLRGEPSPWLHRSVSKPMALPSPGPLVIAGLLLPNTNLLCSAPVHSISPFLPSGETTSSFTLRLLFSQASVLPNRLPGTLPSTGLRDLPALPSARQRDLLHGVQPALLPGLLLLPQAGLGA